MSTTAKPPRNKRASRAQTAHPLRNSAHALSSVEGIGRPRHKAEIHKSDDKHPFGDLPFVRTLQPSGTGRDWWTPNSTDCYEIDMILGRHLGEVALRASRDHDFFPSPGLLIWVVGAMVTRGQFGALEHSFLHVFARAAVRGAQ